MQRSTERILTTHIGSLPRPDGLRDLLLARDQDQAYDQSALAQRVRAAVRDAVKQQADVGLDVVADGGYIMPGTRVQVIEVEGNRVVVKEV